MMNKKFIITVSYGDYTIGYGGTDKVILAHQRILNNAGYNVIHLSSCSEFSDKGWWHVLLNGVFRGIYSNNRLKRFIFEYQESGNKLFDIFIHHLKDVNSDSLQELLDYCDVPIVFYLHDYFTICPKNGLIKEDGTFCGNGFPSKNKCGSCAYYLESKDLLKKTKNLLSKYQDRLIFIAPSDAAKNVWLKDYPEYSDKIKVIYHQNIVGEYKDNNDIISNDEPIRIGFVGYQRPLKGWKQYKNAVEKAHSLNLNEEFYQFGWGDEELPYVEQVDVDFKTSMTAMTDALRSKKIHCAVIWSMWPETYAYTYYESMAANCFIITNDLSGNVCSQVKTRNNGIVSDDLSDTLCDEKKLRALINSFRKNSHITPYELNENEEFIGMIKENSWIPEKVKQSFDMSVVVSLLKRAKNILKK